jgi:cation transport ATPase
MNSCSYKNIKEAENAGVFIYSNAFANMWLAVLADSGVALLCVLNSVRILYAKNKRLNRTSFFSFPGV